MDRLNVAARPHLCKIDSSIDVDRLNVAAIPHLRKIDSSSDVDRLNVAARPHLRKIDPSSDAKIAYCNNEVDHYKGHTQPLERIIS